MEIKIFLFHRVSSEVDYLWPPITAQKFKLQVAYIHKTFKVVPLEPVLLGVEKTNATKPLAAIVFDDGYRDFYENALPILRGFGIKPSMYIIANCVENNQPPWPYILDSFFQKTNKLDNVFIKDLPAAMNIEKWETATQRIEFGRKLKPYLKTVSNVTRVNVFKTYAAHFKDVEIPDNLIMTWDMIRSAQMDGVIIGSHSANHPLLGEITDEQEIRYELETSRDKIQMELGEAPLTISYPFGSYNDAVKKVAQQAGYKIGLAVKQTTYSSYRHGMYEVPRIELYNESMWKSKLRMYEVITMVKKILGK